jgi:hypothetical protein
MTKATLEMTFYGPFVTLLNCDPIKVYAPRCIGHYARIFTTETEGALPGDRLSGGNVVYRVTRSGIKPCKSCKQANPAAHLNVPTNYGITKDVSRSLFCFELPKPRRIAAIGKDSVIVTGTNAPSGNAWATATRFIFDFDGNQRRFEVGDGTTRVLATTLEDYSVTNHFEVTVQFIGPFIFDPDHNDAKDCFQASARLFQHSSSKADLDWGLDYSGVGRNGRADGRPGGDCESPHLVSK